MVRDCSSFCVLKCLSLIINEGCPKIAKLIIHCPSHSVLIILITHYHYYQSMHSDSSLSEDVASTLSSSAGVGMYVRDSGTELPGNQFGSFDITSIHSC